MGAKCLQQPVRLYGIVRIKVVKTGWSVSEAGRVDNPQNGALLRSRKSYCQTIFGAAEFRRKVHGPIQRERGKETRIL